MGRFKYFLPDPCFSGSGFKKMIVIFVRLNGRRRPVVPPLPPAGRYLPYFIPAFKAMVMRQDSKLPCER